jgi:transcriptional regulator with XRE-family HTH domain
MESFGKKFYELRKQNGLSQAQIAADLDISQSTVSNPESGSSVPDMDISKKIADYCHVPIVYFFSDEKVFFHTGEHHGGNSGYMINSTFNAMSEKLIELYERRIKDLEAEISRLKGNSTM